MTETTAAWLDQGEKKLPLVGRTFSLGRARDNNVVFTSEKVSRRHAIVHGYPCVLSHAAQDALREFGAGQTLGAFPLKGFEGEHELFGWQPNASATSETCAA